MSAQERKVQFETALSQYMQKWEAKTPLHEALCYSLTTGGKRIRPQIVLLLGEILDKGAPVMQSALSVEFFHTASLIADDLPCMDNELYRREQLTLHEAYDEETALLASYALITEAFSCIYQNAKEMEKAATPLSIDASRALSLALECTSRVAGIRGATLGQYLDIKRENPSVAELRELVELKTVTLFEGAFVLGWVFGGGKAAQLSQVQKVAHHFGMSFQILDDLQDTEQDQDQSPNIANLLGDERTREILAKERSSLDLALQELGLSQPNRQQVVALLGQEQTLVASSSV